MLMAEFPLRVVLRLLRIAFLFLLLFLLILRSISCLLFLLVVQPVLGGGLNHQADPLCFLLDTCRH